MPKSHLSFAEKCVWMRVCMCCHFASAKEGMFLVMSGSCSKSGIYAVLLVLDTARNEMEKCSGRLGNTWVKCNTGAPLYSSGKREKVYQVNLYIVMNWDFF